MTVRNRPMSTHSARPASRASTFGAVLLVAPLLLAACQPPATPDPGGAEQATERRVINSQLPDRPYSDAVVAGDTYYFSGRIAVTDETVAMEEGRIDAETRGVMESFRPLLAAEGLGFEDVVRTTVYLADMDDYAAMNAVYGEFFPHDPPARETVAVLGIPGGAAVEVSIIAVRR